MVIELLFILNFISLQAVSVSPSSDGKGIVLGLKRKQGKIRLVANHFKPSAIET